MFKKVLLIFFFATINTPFPALAASDVKATELSTPKLTAVATATDRFRADGNKLEGYRLMIVERGDSIEVIFVPGLIKSTNMVGFEKSSRPEIHYYLDATGLVIKKVLLGQ